jgi:hypothetical protein
MRRFTTFLAPEGSDAVANTVRVNDVLTILCTHIVVICLVNPTTLKPQSSVTLLTIGIREPLLELVNLRSCETNSRPTMPHFGITLPCPPKEVVYPFHGPSMRPAIKSMKGTSLVRDLVTQPPLPMGAMLAYTGRGHRLYVRNLETVKTSSERHPYLVEVMGCFHTRTHTLEATSLSPRRRRTRKFKKF